jgi:hypothetical protein
MTLVSQRRANRRRVTQKMKSAGPSIRHPQEYCSLLQEPSFGIIKDKRSSVASVIAAPLL